MKSLSERINEYRELIEELEEEKKEMDALGHIEASEITQDTINTLKEDMNELIEEMEAEESIHYNSNDRMMREAGHRQSDFM
ncbi:hypothetical protein [Bacillus phage CM1]|nr:hypothetical protein [Bacillus phage CM1]